MDLRTTITETGATPKLLARQRRSLQKESLNTIGVMWHDQYRGRHFETSAVREYNYQPRTRVYMLRKARYLHHQRPLVFSGKSEAFTRIRDVRSTSNKVRVVLHAPGLNFRRSARSPNMREEVTAVSQREERALSDRFGEDFAARANRLSDTETTTIT